MVILSELYSPPILIDLLNITLPFFFKLYTSYQMQLKLSSNTALSNLLHLADLSLINFFFFLAKLACLPFIFYFLFGLLAETHDIFFFSRWVSSFSCHFSLSTSNFWLSVLVNSWHAQWSMACILRPRSSNHPRRNKDNDSIPHELLAILCMFTIDWYLKAHNEADNVSGYRLKGLFHRTQKGWYMH